MTAFDFDTPVLNGVITDNVYGRHYAFPLSLEVQAMRVGKSGFLYGAAIGYDMLRSKVDIDSMRVYTMLVNNKIHYKAEGSTTLTNTYINVNPFIGTRMMVHDVTLDFIGGLDLGFCLSSHEKGSAVNIVASPSPPVIMLKTDRDVPHPTLDVCARIQVQATMKRIGLIAGYSLGLTNYQTTGNARAYTSFLRLGLGYRLN